MHIDIDHSMGNKFVCSRRYINFLPIHYSIQRSFKKEFITPIQNLSYITVNNKRQDSVYYFI